MKIVSNDKTSTNATTVIAAEDSELEKYKQAAAKNLADSVKVPGFRPGKAPIDMIIKNLDEAVLANEFLNIAINDLYMQSQATMNLRVVGEPKITVTKFVPFSTLEVNVEVPIIDEIKLPDYKNLGLTKNKQTVTKKLIDQNIEALRKRSAEPKPLKRAAKAGDLVVIDFTAVDSKTKEELPLASAKDYRLILGDNTLIPGFEDNIVGMTIGKTKTFDLTFPKDYTDKGFAGRIVTFKTVLKEVNGLTLPKLDDDFAKSMGPFKNLDELTAAIKQELTAELERQATIDLENRILSALAEKTKADIAESLIDAEQELLTTEVRNSAIQHGQTWQEFLASRNQTEEEYQKEQREFAKTRIKAGLAIGEIANKEDISVSDSEIDQQVANLKRQYSSDEAMQQELDKPANRREIGMRLLTEKVLDFLENTKAKK